MNQSRRLPFISVHGNGVNLVIYPDTTGPEDELAVHDANGLLPRNHSSWR